jgi:hypothetical protein
LHNQRTSEKWVGGAASSRGSAGAEILLRITEKPGSAPEVLTGESLEAMFDDQPAAVST